MNTGRGLGTLRGKLVSQRHARVAFESVLGPRCPACLGHLLGSSGTCKALMVVEVKVVKDRVVCMGVESRQD